MVPFICCRTPRGLPFIGSIRPFVGRSYFGGFTLIEMLVVITLVGILAALAFPNFRTLIQNQRIGTQANDFIADLGFARSEAVKRVGQVGVCVSTDGATCTGGSWNAGRVIFFDSNNDGAWDGQDLVLRVRDSLGGSNTLRPNVALPNDTVLFGPRGTLAAGGPTTFAICDGRGPSHGKAVMINAVGQARVDTNAPGSCN